MLRPQQRDAEIGVTRSLGRRRGRGVHRGRTAAIGHRGRHAELFVQGQDVRLGHLESFVFGQLALVVGGRHDAPEPVKSFVQAVHAAPLARVRRQPPALPASRRVDLCTAAAAETLIATATAETCIATTAPQRCRQTTVSRRLFIRGGGGVTVTTVVKPLQTRERVVERVAIVLRLIRHVWGPQHDVRSNRTACTRAVNNHNNNNDNDDEDIAMRTLRRTRTVYPKTGARSQLYTGNHAVIDLTDGGRIPRQPKRSNRIVRQL